MASLHLRKKAAQMENPGWAGGMGNVDIHEEASGVRITIAVRTSLVMNVFGSIGEI